MSGDLIWCVGRKRVPESCPLPLVVLSESHRVSSAESHISLLGVIAGFFCPGERSPGMSPCRSSSTWQRGRTRAESLLRAAGGGPPGSLDPPLGHRQKRDERGSVVVRTSRSGHGCGLRVGKACLVGVFGSGDDDAVASVALRAQECLVGGVDRFAEGEAGLGRCEPKADGEWGDGAVGECGVESGSDAFDDDDCVFDRAVGEDRDELLAAVARGDVIGAHAVAEYSSEEPQRAVSGVVAVHVVEQLELVEIAVRDDERKTFIGEVTRSGLEAPPVEQAGEWVRVRLSLGPGERSEHSESIAGFAGDEFPAPGGVGAAESPPPVACGVRR